MRVWEGTGLLRCPTEPPFSLSQPRCLAPPRPPPSSACPFNPALVSSAPFQAPRPMGAEDGLPFPGRKLNSEHKGGWGRAGGGLRGETAPGWRCQSAASEWLHSPCPATQKIGVTPAILACLSTTVAFLRVLIAGKLRALCVRVPILPLCCSCGGEGSSGTHHGERRGEPEGQEWSKCGPASHIPPSTAQPQSQGTATTLAGWES